MAAAASKGETIVIGKEGIMPISDRDNLIRLLSDAVKDGSPQYVLRDLNLFDYENRSSFDWYGLGAEKMKRLVKKLFEDKRNGFDVETKQLPFRQEVGTRKAVVGLGLQLPRVTEVFFDAGRSPQRQVDTFGKPLNVVVTFGTYIDPGRKPSHRSNYGVKFVVWPRIGDTIDIPQTTFDSIGILDTTLTATLLRKTYSDTHWNYSIESQDSLGGYADIKHDGTSPDPNMKTYFAGNETKKQKKEEGDYYGTTANWEVEMYKHILAKELGDTVQVMLYAAWANRHPDREAIFLTEDIMCFLLCLYYRKACLVGGKLGEFGTNMPIDQIPASVRSGNPHTALWYVGTRDPLSRAKLDYRSTRIGIATNNKRIIDTLRKDHIEMATWVHNLKVGSRTVESARVPNGFWQACLADLIDINKSFKKRSLSADQFLAKHPELQSKEDKIKALRKRASGMKYKYHLMTVIAKDRQVIGGTHWTQKYDMRRPNLTSYVETRLKMVKSMKIDGTMWDELNAQQNPDNVPLESLEIIMAKAHYAVMRPELQTAAYRFDAWHTYTPIQSAGGRMQEGGLGGEDEGGELIDFLAPIPPELIQNDGMSISFIQAIRQNQEYLKVPNLVDVVGFPEVDTSPMMYHCDPDVQPGDESYIPGCEGKGEVDLNAMYLSSIGEAVAELGRRYPGANIPTADDVYWWLYNTSLVYDMDQLIVTADYLEQAFIPHYWNLAPVDIELTDEAAVPVAAAPAAAAAAAPPRAMEVERPPTPEVRPGARAGMGAPAPRGFSPPPESLMLSVSALPRTARSGPASKMRSAKHTRRARATTPRLSTTGKRPQNVLDRAEHALEAIFAGGKKRKRRRRTQRRSKTKRTGKKGRTTAARRRTHRKTRKQEKRR